MKSKRVEFLSYPFGLETVLKEREYELVKTSHLRVCEIISITKGTTDKRKKIPDRDFLPIRIQIFDIESCFCYFNQIKTTAAGLFETSAFTKKGKPKEYKVGSIVIARIGNNTLGFLPAGFRRENEIVRKATPLEILKTRKSIPLTLREHIEFLKENTKHEKIEEGLKKSLHKEEAPLSVKDYKKLLRLLGVIL